MTPLDRIVGAALAILVLAAVVWASNAPITANRSADAVLRLAWSARPERVEKCRQRSAEELARLPQHMRQPIECEGTTAEYRLQVRIDGALVADRVFHGGGLRRDRRLYVFEELAIPPGQASIDVRFDRVTPDHTGTGTDSNPAANPGSTPPARATEAVPPHLALERRLHFVSREATLVTYSPEGRTLVAVQNDDAAARPMEPR